MEDIDNPRVQAHAGAALVNFCEDCPKQILVPYLDSILGKLDLVLAAKLREVCLWYGTGAEKALVISDVYFWFQFDVDF